MLRVLVGLLVVYRIALAELAGVAVLAAAAGSLFVAAGWGVIGLALLLKAAEWDARGARRRT